MHLIKLGSCHGWYCNHAQWITPAGAEKLLSMTDKCMGKHQNGYDGALVGPACIKGQREMQGVHGNDTAEFCSLPGILCCVQHPRGIIDDRDSICQGSGQVDLRGAQCNPDLKPVAPQPCPQPPVASIL